MTYLVARNLPATFRDKLGDTLVDIRASSGNIILRNHISIRLTPDNAAVLSANAYHSQLIKRPSALNILECLLQILKLLINLRLRSLSALHSLRLKRLNSFDLPVDIVLLDLEALELLLDVLYDVLVAQVLAVVLEVDGLRRFFEDIDATAGIVIALFESYEGVGGTASET